MEAVQTDDVPNDCEAPALFEKAVDRAQLTLKDAEGRYTQVCSFASHRPTTGDDCIDGSQEANERHGLPEHVWRSSPPEPLEEARLLRIARGEDHYDLVHRRQMRERSTRELARSLAMVVAAVVRGAEEDTDCSRAVELGETVRLH